MAEKKKLSVFQNIGAALNRSRRKSDAIDPKNTNLGPYQTMPQLDVTQGVEQMQQQFLDWQIHKISHDLYTRTVYYDTDRIAAYQDFRAMDGTPEIAAALNILRDECIDYETVIQLLGSEQKTIEELFNEKRNNFYVCSYNTKLKEQEIAICERVAYKGEQDCYKVTFNNDSYIMATSEHLWLVGDENKYLKTRELYEGLSIQSLYTILPSGSKSGNYSIKNIELIGKRRTYDLVNVGEHNNFAVLTSDKKSGVFVHNCLTRGESGEIFSIYSENIRVKEVLEDLFRNVLSIEFNLRLWIRDLIKYGDYFVFLNVDRELGIYDFLTLPMEEVHREEGYDGRIDSIRFRWETTGDYFEDWQVAHFRLLEDSRKLPYGRCLKSDTYIETVSGVKFIKDIKIGDIVFSFDLKTHKKIESKVLDIVCSGKKQIYKIRTKNNEIETSLEHNFLIFKNDEFVYKPASKLNIGDLLVIEKENYNIIDKIIIDKTEFINTINWNDYKRNLDLIPNSVTEDFAMLFGFMLGDGWISNNAVYIALGENEEINNKYCSFLREFSGKEIKLKNKVNKSKLEHPQAWVNSKMLKEILQKMGFKGKCYEKRLPEWIFTAPYNIKKALIEGLIDSDGSENIDEWNCKRYSIELTSEYLIKDLKTLLQRMGVKSGKICSRNRKSTIIWGKKYNTKKSFYLYFYDSKLKQTEKHNLIKDRKDNNFILTPIICIEKTFEKSAVYDICVENENHNFYANGIVVHNSILDSSRKLWKQLQLAEDAMLIYRIVRAPERRVFFIEVGNLPDSDVKTYVQKMQNQIRKQPVVDQKTSQMSMRYNPENVTEDYWIPIRGDKSSRIETLPGASNLSDIQDIEYLQNKLFAALQVPKTYLNYAQSMPGGSTLSQADIRFARTIVSIQEALLLELRRVANIHLYFLGFEDDMDNFKLTLTNPSTQQELLKLEVMKARLEVFKEFHSSEATAPSSYTWAMEQVLGFSKSDIKLILMQKKIEKKLFTEIDAAAETYKKIGLFNNLDSKYEDPQAVAQLAAGGGEGEDKGGGGSPGGGGGGSILGNLPGAGGAEESPGMPPEEDMGGTGEPGAGGPEAEENPKEEPEEKPKISESMQKKLNFIKESEAKMNGLLEELLGPDVTPADTVQQKRQQRKNVLFENNSKFTVKSQKLLNNLNKAVNKAHSKFIVEDINSIPLEEYKENNLIKGSQDNIAKTNEIFEALDSIINDKKDGE